jgi:hypothetical protein
MRVIPYTALALYFRNRPKRDALGRAADGRTYSQYGIINHKLLTPP